MQVNPAFFNLAICAIARDILCKAKSDIRLTANDIHKLCL